MGAPLTDLRILGVRIRFSATGRRKEPARVGVALYAILTGVFLWVASLVGGTFENWFVVSKLPDAIANSRLLRALVGSESALRISRFVLLHVSGFRGSVSLGFMLGMVGLLGHLLGIPIEVRHVTFATGQLTFAGISLGPEAVIQPDFLWAVAAISVIGACNFGVSFALALFVAFRAREIRRRCLSRRRQRESAVAVAVQWRWRWRRSSLRPTRATRRWASRSTPGSL
jgi:site-specific recombinase